MDDDNSTSIDSSSSPPALKYILLLIIEILSLICTLLILTYLFHHWKSMIKKALRNHTIFLLVIISFLNTTLDLPFTINSDRLGYDQPRTPSFCLWWYWIDYTLIIISLFLTAIASVQRHILIFNAHLFYSYRARCFLHYIPIFICLLYPVLFYLSVIVLYPCTQASNETSTYCNAPCYTDSFTLFNVDWIFNTALPLLTIVLANIALVIRVIHSMKKTRKQAFTWKRQRKLTLQLLTLSSLYVFGWAPSTVISILQSFTLPNLLDDIPQLDYMNFLTFFVCPAQSLVCLLGLPGLMKFMKNLSKQVFRRTLTTPVAPIRANLNK